MKSFKSKLSLFSLCMISGYSAVSMANETSNKKETQQPDDIIIVVGERVDRSEVETGSSVNIITNKELERRPDLYSLNQVLKETPNIIDTGLGNELPTIRGIEGSNSPGSMAFFQTITNWLTVINHYGI
jgi:Outer membrane receptor for ferrienterochelin and colicins